MLNEEKIKWMTRASIYEKREGKIDLKRNEYFISDYVRMNLLKNLVCETVAYLLILSLYVLYNVEEILTQIANLQILLLLKEMLAVYVIILIVYTGVGLILYAWQYQKSHKRIKKYYRMLRHIDDCD